MRIAYLYPFWFDFPRAYVDNAMDVVGRELPRRVAGRGHRATLYSAVRTRSSTRELVRGSTVSVDGVDHRRLAQISETLARVAVSGRLRIPVGRDALREEWYGPGASLRRQLSYGVPAALGARRAEADVVHVCIFDELVPVVRALHPRSAIVLHMHDHKQAHRPLEATRRRLAAADAIVGCSGFVTDAVGSRFPELASRCRTIWNAVERFPAPPSAGPPGPPRVLFTGRLSPEKGVHVVLDAFERILAHRPDAELVVAGTDDVAPVQDADPTGRDPRLADVRDWYGDSRRYPAHLRGRLPAPARDRVRFVGPTEHAETRALVASADAILFPSLWDEPFGLPVIEGMSAGKAVVATRVGAFPEIVEDGVSGVLVDPGDASGLADAVLRLLADDDLRARVGAAAAERAAALFSWERCLDSWEDLYSRL